MIVLKIIGGILLGILALILVVLCIRIRVAIEYSDDNTNVSLEWLFLKIPLYPSAKKQPKAEKSKKKQKTDAEPMPEPEPEEPVPEEPEPEEPVSEESVLEEPDSATEETQGETTPAEKKESLLHIIYKAHGIDGLIQIVRKVFSYLGTFMGDMLKSLVVEELYLDIGCTKSDAAKTAVYYGEVCSTLYPMLGALASKCKIKKYDINIYPDYLARFSKASFYVKFHLYPIYLCHITIMLVLRLVFKVLIGFIVKIFLPKKEKKAENKNIKKEKRDVSNEGSVSSRDSVNNDREGSSAC